MRGTPSKKDPRTKRITAKVYDIDYRHPGGFGCMHVRVEAKNIPHALERAETLLDSGVMWEPEKIEEVSGEQYNDMMSQLRAFLANGGVMPRMNLAFPLEEGSQLDVGNVVALKPKADDEKPDEGGDADA